MKSFIKLLALISLIFSLFVIYDRAEMQKPVAFDVLNRIDPIPKTKKYIKQNKYLQAQEYLSFFMNYKYVKENPKAQELLLQIKRKRETIEYKTDKVIGGILSGKSDELEGQIAVGVSDLFLFGDLRDLAIEGYHHVSGEKVDKVLVALSSIGVIATGITIASGGATVYSKGILSFLKFARKSGKMPSWLSKHLIKSSKEMKGMKNLDSLKGLFSDIYHMVKVSGVNGGLKLLGKTTNLKSFKKVTEFSKTFGKRSSALVDILGSDTLTLFSKMNVSKKAFLNAATYGRVGVKRVIKLGEKGFLKSLKKVRV